MSETPASRGWLLRIGDFVGSFGLACVVLLHLAFLTWAGTLAQVQLGLHEAQRTYFDSIYFWQELPALGITIPLPGAYIALAVLAVNLIVGGVIRLRKSRRTAGILIGHLGILLLLAAGVVKFHDSDEGAIELIEGQSASEFVSFLEWEIAIAEPLEDGRLRERIIPADRFAHLEPHERATFESPSLPFSLVLSRFARNSFPRPAGATRAGAEPVVDGFFLAPLPLDSEAERNGAGVYVDVIPADGSPVRPGILWGHQTAPLTVNVAGRDYAFELRKKVYPLDCAIRLDKFQKLDHPGTKVAADFRSWVTRIEDGREERVEISMNEPMRHNGYIFYQTRYQPPDEKSNGSFYSIIAVVRNPSDQWPLYSCLIIALGLVIHFGTKLLGYARAQQARLT